ncbi:MAG: hypothetical protein FWB93_00640, partial [Oscillospiraceae bacterium]|nr:hypothetical protein [Oscillospiraceae bacterium]
RGGVGGVVRWYIAGGGKPRPYDLRCREGVVRFTPTPSGANTSPCPRVAVAPALGCAIRTAPPSARERGFTEMSVP